MASRNSASSSRRAINSSTVSWSSVGAVRYDRAQIDRAQLAISERQPPGCGGEDAPCWGIVLAGSGGARWRVVGAGDEAIVVAGSALAAVRNETRARHAASRSLISSRVHRIG